MTTNKILLNLVAGASLLAVTVFSGVAKADNIPINDPDLADTGLGEWNTLLSIGNGGTYDPNNPTVAGSTAINPYSTQGGITGLTGLPSGDTTAGTFTADAGDSTPAGLPTAEWTSNLGNVFTTATRASSTDGDLYSFYQNTGVQFARNTTYTLTAYASGIGSGTNGFANTGVGFSGTSALQAYQLEANPNLAGLGQSSGSTLQFETVTIDTSNPEFSSLVGQTIIVNLLDEATVTGGGRSVYFTDVNLTSETDAVPEPSTWAMMLGGLGLLAFFRWRARRASLLVCAS